MIDLSPIWLTLKVAALATGLAMIFGVVSAFILMRRRFPGSNWLDAALTLPLVLPPTVLGYYLIVLLGRNGWLGRWLKEYFGIGLMFAWQGAVIAAAVVCLPLVYKTARAAFEAVDNNFEQAARTLGAGEWTLFWRIFFPLAWRGILAGTMLAFARSMGEFGATLMIAGNLPGRTQTLSTAIYSAVQAGQDHHANVLVIIASVLGLLILYGSGRLLKTRVGI
jgi:molybdate transport system permease protein